MCVLLCPPASEPPVHVRECLVRPCSNGLAGFQHVTPGSRRIEVTEVWCSWWASAAIPARNAGCRKVSRRITKAAWWSVSASFRWGGPTSTALKLSQTLASPPTTVLYPGLVGPSIALHSVPILHYMSSETFTVKREALDEVRIGPLQTVDSGPRVPRPYARRFQVPVSESPEVTGADRAGPEAMSPAPRASFSRSLQRRDICRVLGESPLVSPVHIFRRLGMTFLQHGCNLMQVRLFSKQWEGPAHPRNDLWVRRVEVPE